MPSPIIDVVSATGAILGFAGTMSGFVSWLYERSVKRRILLADKRRIWTDISKVRGLMADLEKDGPQQDGNHGRMQAIGKLSFMLRDLIREACMSEDNLSIDMIRRWRRVGKLGSDWQEQLALNVLISDEIDDEMAAQLPPSYAGWDELPEAHPAYAGLAARRHLDLE